MAAGFFKSAVTLFYILTLFNSYIAGGYKQNIFESLSPAGMEETETPLGFSDDEPDESIPPLGISGMAGVAPKAANERTVKNFAELSDALSKNNGVTIVHLGNDIVMTAGIRIHESKANIIIDGIDPDNPNQISPYTLTDLNIAAFAAAIYVDSTAVKNVHVKDLKIIGKNFFGPVSILDSALMFGTALTFERVDYNGPQLGYHRYGTVRYIDCTAKIHGGNGVSESQEFSESKNIIFEGKNNIEMATTLHSVFWMLGGGSFTLADNSSVTVVSPNTSKTEGIFYGGLPSYRISITIGMNAVLDIKSSAMIAPALFGKLSGVTVREGGALRLTGTGVPSEAFLAVNGDITAEPDSEITVNLSGGGAVPVSIASGDVLIEKDAVFHIFAGNGSSAALELNGQSLICADPASVVLYNTEKRDILASSSASISVETEQVNLWTVASTGGLDDPPKYGWRKANRSNFTVSASLAAGDKGGTESINSNYTTGDPPGNPPDATSFDMAAARVLAFGRLELEAEAPAAYSTQITGVTAPNAEVRASFSVQGEAYRLDTHAGNDGVFVINTGVELPPDTEITVDCAHRWLTARQSVFVLAGEGEISFSVPEELIFQTPELSAVTQTVHRQNPGWHIVVSDTRATGGKWRVYAREISPLTPPDSEKPPLERALVFMGEDGSITSLDGENPLEIYRHDAVDTGTVSIHWNQDAGILVIVPTGAAYADTLYTGVIEWTLADAP